MIGTIISLIFTVMWVATVFIFFLFIYNKINGNASKKVDDLSKKQDGSTEIIIRNLIHQSEIMRESNDLLKRLIVVQLK
jgi:uncharacterized membrane protein